MHAGSHRPRKRFGQHFLHDPGVVRRIVAAIAPAPGDFILEIGPGEGVLTRPLRERAARLEAIEIDRDLAARLVAEGVVVHAGDALEFDYGALPPGARIVGNLPYNISTPLLFRLAEHAARFRDLHFMLQREVVERMVAAPSTRAYGRLSVMLQARFSLESLFRVAPGAFRPPPGVESAVVRLRPLEAPLDLGVPGFAGLVRRAFSARRKTLRNALGLSAESLAGLGYDPGLRPENLSAADYVRIAQRTKCEPGFEAGR
ncbi:MAG: 16S rRNA (adenine(1518)-N(6)/adenine(1519)-N(6))-dimethyltransferase RsmA [Burkholderiales bacterium]